MMTARTVAACAFAMTIFGNRLDAQDLSRYRTFELGFDVAAVSALTGVAASEATIVHQRPVLLQDLAWRRSRWTPGSNSDSTDPVEQVLFSFYNDHLFRIAVDYGHDRTEGMTERRHDRQARLRHHLRPLSTLPPMELKQMLSPGRCSTESGGTGRVADPVAG
jgi:hypothetical protein